MSNLPKTLYIILNHNAGQISTIYYEEMKYYQEQDNFDLLLIDNGSKPSERSMHTTHSFKKNVYFNGAIQWAFKYMLDHPEYEYLVFSNNDIFLHGYRFVENMVTIAEENNFTMIAPAGIEGNAGQNFWPIMHCWYKKEPRVVPWIDFICPFINRRLIEEIQQFPSWWRSPSYGFDDYCSITCNRKGWKIGVSDLMTIFHIGQYTYREQYGERADDGLDLYTMQSKHRDNFDWNFKRSGLKDEMYEGYYGLRPTVDRQWFRSNEQREVFKKREEILENNYMKRKGLK